MIIQRNSDIHTKEEKTAESGGKGGKMGRGRKPGGRKLCIKNQIRGHASGAKAEKRGKLKKGGSAPPID